jgi:ATP-dependent RNA helicase DDX18/HAS1
MDSVELQGKKRKRKHSSSKALKEDAVSPLNVAGEANETEVKAAQSKSEKAHKKAKKARRSNDDVEEQEEEMPEDSVNDEDSQLDDEKAREEVGVAHVNEEENVGGEDLEPVEGVPGVGSLSLPNSGIEAQNFDQLVLSEKTMKAIGAMGFLKVC